MNLLNLHCCSNDWVLKMAKHASFHYPHALWSIRLKVLRISSLCFWRMLSKLVPSCVLYDVSQLREHTSVPVIVSCVSSNGRMMANHNLETERTTHMGNKKSIIREVMSQSNIKCSWPLEIAWSQVTMFFYLTRT